MPPYTQSLASTLIARFMGPTWGPSGADRTQVSPMLAPWTLLSGQGCASDSLYIPPLLILITGPEAGPHVKTAQFTYHSENNSCDHCKSFKCICVPFGKLQFRKMQLDWRTHTFCCSLISSWTKWCIKITVRFGKKKLAGLNNFFIKIYSFGVWLMRSHLWFR